MPLASFFQKKPWRWALVAAALLAAAAGVRAWRGPEVPAYAAARGTVVERVVATGQVMPPARISLAALQLAQVAQVRVREGDRVRRGDLLLQLDDAEARAQLAQARAQVAQAQARLAQVHGTGARVAGEALRQAEVRLAQAETQLGRTQARARGGAASEQELDEARQAMEVTRSQEQAASAQALATAEAGSDFRLAAAALAQARAQLWLAETRLAQARLVAPADGVVLTRASEPGDVVVAGKPLLVMSADGETRLSVQPDEKNLALLQVGQRSLATADAFPGEPFEAVVAYIAPSVDPTRGTVEVRLAVPRPPPTLRPDMTVSVNVEVARHPAAVYVPADAVRGDGDGTWVLALVGGRAERRPVTAGVRGQGVVEVRSGLAEGEPVVPVTATARPGDRARPRLLPVPREAARAL